MSYLPEQLIASLQNVKGFAEQPFIDVHESGRQVTSIRINPAKPSVLPEGVRPVPWSSTGYYLPERPAFVFDPLLHAGAYYVQEASSMFLEQCICQHTDLSQPLKVLDLCASPGGKSTLIQALISEESLLVSNEVIKTRVAPLVENLSKWGYPNNVVTNNDPRDFQKLDNFFDVMVVDAPCSGSGLFRRDPEAVKQWSPETVEMCSMRQQRILQDAYPALKKDGLLIYSTCSYSAEENEQITKWLLGNFALEPLAVELLPAWNIVGTEGYRFFPDRLQGEGFYISAFRKKDGEVYESLARPRFTVAAERKELGRWVDDPAKYQFYYLDKEVFAFPVALAAELAAVQSTLYLRKAGVLMGRLAQGELIPAHELAISTIVNKQIQSITLNKAEALQYLRKEELRIAPGNRGWALAQYGGLNLGWMKLLNNRVNNYYPKEWRILKSPGN